MFFLELRRDSQVMTGNSGFHYFGPGKSNLPFELRGRAVDCSRVTAGQNRPHIGLYPGPNVPLQVQGAARENGVLCPKDTALGAASVLEGLLANIALCPATSEIRRLFTAGTWSCVQTSHTQRNVIWCKK